MTDETEALADPELQSRLDAAFAATRPRRGFETELWTRLERRRPWWRRPTAPDFVRGLSGRAWAGLGAVAVVLAAVIGMTPVLLAHTGHGGAPGTASLASPAAGAAASQSKEAAAAAFGKLPVPALAASGAPSPSLSRPGVDQPPTAAAQPYLGPAQLTLGGALPALPATLPVWRFQVPSPASLDELARSLGGTAAAAGATGYREPLVVIQGGGATAATADGFLRAHGAYPAWPHQTHAGAARVVYVRQFETPGGLRDQIDQQGEPAGAEVDLDPSGGAQRAVVPLPSLRLTLSSYATRTATRAGQDAVSGPATAGSPPVTLGSPLLVYLAVDGGAGRGFFEPALLFAGTFNQGGSSFEKRVLVPAIDPSQLE